MTIRRLLQSRFWAWALTLTTGTALAQLISLLCAPLLTRLYLPADMGVLATMNAVVAVLAVISTGQYEQALMLPADEREALGVARVARCMVVLSCVLLLLVVQVAGPPLAARMGLAAEQQFWVYIVPFLVGWLGLERILVRLHTRSQRFRPLAWAQVIQQAGSSTGKIGLGLMGHGVAGLLVGTAVGHLMRWTTLALTWRQEPRTAPKPLPVAALWALARRYRRFPLWASGAGVVQALAEHLPVLLFTALYKPAVVGQFALAYTILRLPATLVGMNVNHVFLERLVRTRNDQPTRARLAADVYVRMLGLGVLLLPVMTFYGDSLFPWVFGAAWDVAGQYARWLSVWLLFVFAAIPLRSVYLALEYQAEGLWWNVGLLLALAVAIIAGHGWGAEPLGVIALCALAGVVSNWLFAARMLFLAGVRFWDVLQDSFVVCVAGFGGHLAIYGLLRWWDLV